MNVAKQPSASPNQKPDIWSDDLLGRRHDAAFLINFLTRRVAERTQEGLPQSYVLNLNSRWGEGKTFFLKRLHQQLITRGYLATYVDAWKDDHADTPLIAVMAQIEASLKPYMAGKAKRTWEKALKSLGHVAVASAKGAIKQAGKKYIGEAAADAVAGIGLEGGIAGDAAESAIDTLADKLGETLLKGFRERSESIEAFKTRLAELLVEIQNAEHKHLPLFVLVDELDRCRPTYSIAMLEQIKHLFDIPMVVFVIATDSDQLTHSIRAVYGAGFAADHYLHRFFDRTYVFEEPERGPYIESLFKRFSITADQLEPLPDYSVPKHFLVTCRDFGLSLRSIEQCFDLLRNAVTVWPHSMKLQMGFLVPLIILHHLNRPEFDRLVKGYGEEVKELQHGSELPNRRGEVQTVRHYKILQAFAERVKHGFEPRNVFDGDDVYATNVFDKERMARGLDADSKHLSYLSEYGRLIRSATRLEKPKPENSPRQEDGSQ